jgi:YD repeat-containing protein
MRPSASRGPVYNNADLPVSITTPAPGTGEGPQTTTYSYTTLGRLSGTGLPDGGSVQYEYLPSGELMAASGSRTYPAGYNYDAQGRLTHMTNWTGFPTVGARVTTWNYHAYLGFLSQKRYPDTTGPDYTYLGRTVTAGRVSTSDQRRSGRLSWFRL